MTAIQDSALQLPFERSGVLQISPRYAMLRDQSPVVRVATPTGDPAWLVIAFDEAKIAFSDRRFGYYVHPEPDKAARMSDAAVHSEPMGGLDFEAGLGRMRRLLSPGFTPKRMRLLQGWIQELTDGCLDQMQEAHDRDPDEPVDYHAQLGFRLPVLVIGALLGLPDEYRDHMIVLSDRMGATHGGDDARAAHDELQEYMSHLVELKRDDLGEDIISDLIRAEETDPDLFGDRTPASYAAALVFPGHETTVARLDFGLLYLLDEPTRRDWLMEDAAGRIDQTVEEILRMTSAHNMGLMRYALEDIELGGVTIRRGDLVIISESAANEDPSVFANPEEFDPRREPHPHLAFGHGAHGCIGQNLARTELRVVFPSLFRRFPEARLAIDVNELQIDNDRTGGGINRLPLIW